MAKKQVLNYETKVIVNPGTVGEARYDELLPAEKRTYGIGAYLVRLHGKWGVIDANGRVVVPLEYDHLMHLRTLLIASNNGQSGLIDYHGNTVFPFSNWQLLQEDVELLDQGGEGIHGAIIFKQWDGTLTLQGIAEYPSGRVILEAGPHEILRRSDGFLVRTYKYHADKNDLHHPTYRLLDFAGQEIAAGEDMYQLGINGGLI